MTELFHEGMPMRSGRYPYGSGANPQRSKDTITKVKELKGKGYGTKVIAEKLGMTETELKNEIILDSNHRKNLILDSVHSMKDRGMSDAEIQAKVKADLTPQEFLDTIKDIAPVLGMNSTQTRTASTLAKNEYKKQIAADVALLAAEGMSGTKIAVELGVSEGTVRNVLGQKGINRVTTLDNAANELKKAIDKDKFIDVGPGVEIQMGITRSKLDSAVSKLVEEEGYYKHMLYPKRINNRHNTLTMAILTKEPDLEIVKHNSDKVRTMDAFTEDGGHTYQTKPFKLVNVDWKKLDINYAETGGTDKDGLIEIRRGVKDLDMGESKYAQVRIPVGGTHYLKGMAIYSDDLPPGKDIRFNTNKGSKTAPADVLKPLKSNPANPFGATIKPKGQRGSLNIVYEEGDWHQWAPRIASQFLSKQPTRFVKERLDDTYKALADDFDEINSLTNPVVKKYLLNKYAEGADSKTHQLKALGVPKTKPHVLLPFPDMNPNEVYAPGYRDGDRVVLLRYPHGGTFELPELTVNNKGPARKVIANGQDAIGIHPTVAQKLSGADFDGDTVTVIPNNDRKIKTTKSLEGLKDFDAKELYKLPNEVKINTQSEMGKISNLITDMTIKNATSSELARAVRHSMVVIDAEKHWLDYKQSAIDNKISELTKTYQTHISPFPGKEGKVSKAASTLISRSKKKDRDTNEYLIDKVYERDGSFKALSSGSDVEELYVDYANRVKALGNKAYKASMAVPLIKKDPIASAKYKEEVDSLNVKLTKALSNAPKERQAQLLATSNYYKNLAVVQDSLKEGEKIKDADKKKMRSQALNDARDSVGANREMVKITPNEWEAIQNNAVSNNTLINILKNADIDELREYSMPKPVIKLPSAKLTRAVSLLDKGYTQQQVADALGISISTLNAGLDTAKKESRRKALESGDDET